MDNLRRDTKIGGQKIFNPMNHGSEGNPHPQYIKQQSGNTQRAQNEPNKWFLLARISLDVQFNSCSAVLNVCGGITASQNASFAKIMFRVYQQNVMGQLPVTEITLLNKKQVNERDLRAIVTKNTTNLTEVELYMKNRLGYETYSVQLSQKNNKDSEILTFSGVPFISEEALPSGTVVNVSPNNPYVRAYPSSNQSIPVGVNTKLLYGTTVSDDRGNYSNSRFTVHDDGIYTVFASAKLPAFSGRANLILYINGIYHTVLGSINGHSSLSVVLSGSIPVKLSTDGNIEIYISCSEAVTLQSNSSDSIFVVTKIS